MGITVCFKSPSWFCFLNNFFSKATDLYKIFTWKTIGHKNIFDTKKTFLRPLKSKIQRILKIYKLWPKCSTGFVHSMDRILRQTGISSSALIGNSWRQYLYWTDPVQGDLEGSKGRKCCWCSWKFWSQSGKEVYQKSVSWVDYNYQCHFLPKNLAVSSRVVSLQAWAAKLQLLVTSEMFETLHDNFQRNPAISQHMV